MNGVQAQTSPSSCHTLPGACDTPMVARGRIWVCPFKIFLSLRISNAPFGGVSERFHALHALHHRGPFVEALSCAEQGQRHTVNVVTCKFRSYTLSPLPRSLHTNHAHLSSCLVSTVATQGLSL